MSIVRTTPTGTRNGLEAGFHDYAYRGVKTLEAELPIECRGGCGRRMEETGYALRDGLCAVCRGSDYHVPGSRKPTGGGRPKCGECGHELRSASHRRKCGRAGR